MFVKCFESKIFDLFSRLSLKKKMWTYQRYCGNRAITGVKYDLKQAIKKKFPCICYTFLYYRNWMLFLRSQNFLQHSPRRDRQGKNGSDIKDFHRSEKKDALRTWRTILLTSNSRNKDYKCCCATHISPIESPNLFSSRWDKRERVILKKIVDTYKCVTCENSIFIIK